MDYQSALDQLTSDFISHEILASGLLEGIGATELARINEEFASQLSVQLVRWLQEGCLRVRTVKLMSQSVITVTATNKFSY